MVDFALLLVIIVVAIMFDKPEPPTERATQIKRCTCYSRFQDKRYGLQMRVHNRTRDGKWRCTVCGRVK